MDEKRKEKLENFKVRQDKMNDKFDAMKLEDEELDKDMREKFRSCFAHQV